MFSLALVCYTPRKGLASWRNVYADWMCLWLRSRAFFVAYDWTTWIPYGSVDDEHRIACALHTDNCMHGVSEFLCDARQPFCGHFVASPWVWVLQAEDTFWWCMAVINHVMWVDADAVTNRLKWTFQYHREFRRSTAASRTMCSVCDCIRDINCIAVINEMLVIVNVIVVSKRECKLSLRTL